MDGTGQVLSARLDGEDNGASFNGGTERQTTYLNGTIISNGSDLIDGTGRQCATGVVFLTGLDGKIFLTGLDGKLQRFR